jgi:hypothetical protein
MFDQAQRFLLLERRLCAAGGPCEDLAAHALGWLVPGETVGTGSNFGD